MRKIIVVIITILFLFSTIAPTFAIVDVTPNAKSSILIDGSTGEVLFRKNENGKFPPASVTKVMTLLLIMEAIETGKITYEDTVTISEYASSMGGSQLYLEPYENRTVDEMITGIAVSSANDACVAMAEKIDGSVPAFVDNMNKRAKELGMNNTNFVNTNGLPAENHYSTAYDIALMSRELMKHDDIRKYLSIWMTPIKIGKNNDKVLELANTNKMIRYYSGCVGIKTGFTREAMYCLSTAAQRGDFTLIGVVLGEPTSKIRFNEARALLDYGYSKYTSVKLANKGDTMEEIIFEKAGNESVNLVPIKDKSMLFKKGEEQGITNEVVTHENIELPIAKGDVLGKLVIKNAEGVEIDSVDLVADRDLDRLGLFEMFGKVLGEVVR